MKSRKIIKTAAIIITMAVMYCSCTKKNFEKLHPLGTPGTPVAVCDSSGVISYSLQVASVLSSNCSIPSCHSSSSPGGGVDLSSYTGVFNCASSGKMVSCVIWDGNASAMPKNATAKISDCDITKIKKWVFAGAPNN